MHTLPVHDLYRGRNVLLTGASGFLAKVWLAMALDRLPEIGRIHVLLRRKGDLTARQRLEQVFATSPVFRPLHERFGDRFPDYLAERVEAIDGDVAMPGLGLAPEVAERLHERVDLVIHSAGLVDFDPPLSDAISTNVDGLMNVAEFVRSCRAASLVHVSTCFVAGTRNGVVEESWPPRLAPDGREFDAEGELRRCRQAIAKLKTRTPTDDQEDLLQNELEKALEGGRCEDDEDAIEAWKKRWRDKRAKEAQIAEGLRRAQRWGWTNTYTLSKALAESLLASRYDDIRYAVFRPAIVESALSFPFPGWNEGFNTCGPLSYLVGTWFKHLPVRKGNPFDVIPVDLVCTGITLVGAALIAGKAERLYQCGTSDLNRLTVDRALELTQLWHRQRLRSEGRSVFDRVVRSRWDTTPVDSDFFFGVPNLRLATDAVTSAVRAVSRSGPKPVARAGRGAVKGLERTTRQLRKLERVVELFTPFTHDLHQVFECRALTRLQPVEPELRFCPEAIDWRRYWWDIQVPGLEKWSFPILRGEEPELYHPTYAFHLPDPVDGRNPRDPAEALYGEAV